MRALNFNFFPIDVVGLTNLAQDVRWVAVAACALIWLALGSQRRFERLNPLCRELLLIGCALLAYAFGFRIEFVRGVDGVYWALGALSLPLTLAWVALIGRCLLFVHRQGSGRLVLQVSWVVSAALLAMTLLQPQALPLAVGLAGLLLLGVSWALWRGVAVPAHASQGIGLLLALITMAGMVKTSASLALIAPVLILGIPPLTLNHALGILPSALAGAARRKPHPHQLLGLYITLSGVCVLSVAWLSQAPWLGWMVALLVAFTLPLWVLPSVLTKDWAVTRLRAHLFGVAFHRVDAAQALAKLERFVQEKIPRLVVTPDTTALMRAKHDAAFLTCYDQAALVCADGTGIVWASRWLGAPLPERVTGIDLMQALCERAAKRGYRVFLLGARPGVAGQAADRLQRAYPGLAVVGVHHGYLNQAGTASSAEVVRRVRAARPDILFVGMGAPRQEYWILANRQALGVPVMMGVGGSFDVLAGRLPRAPGWMQRAGLEWLYRLCLEPQRLGRALQIPRFLLALVCLKWVLWLYQSLGSTTSASSS